MSEAIAAADEWYLYLPSKAEPLQPYRSAPTAWPLCAEELRRTESQAHSGNPSALNNLGTTQHSVRGWRFLHPTTAHSDVTGCDVV